MMFLSILCFFTIMICIALLNGSEERLQYEAFVTTPKSKIFALRGDFTAYYPFIPNKTQFGIAYQKGNSFVHFTCII